MARMPGAVWRPLSVNYTAVKGAKTRVILHSTASATSTSQFAWFNQERAKSSSHFHVSDSGTIEQYIDTDYMSWASGEGNSNSISIETQGDGTKPWTPAQMDAIVRIIQWANKVHGVPIRMMQSSRSTEHGVGWHRLGVNGNFPDLPSPLAGRKQRGGGETWSSVVKSCPGDDRIRQVPELVRRAQPTTTAIPVPSADTHTVQAGESWWSISQQYKMDMNTLANLNGKSVSDALYVGDRLRIRAAVQYRVTGADSLNIRTGPDVSYARLGAAPKGTVITATGRTENGWVEGSTPFMLSKGQTGWMSGAELTKV